MLETLPIHLRAHQQRRKPADKKPSATSWSHRFYSSGSEDDPESHRNQMADRRVGPRPSRSLTPFLTGPKFSAFYTKGKRFLLCTAKERRAAGKEILSKHLNQKDAFPPSSRTIARSTAGVRAPTYHLSSPSPPQKRLA